METPYSEARTFPIHLKSDPPPPPEIPSDYKIEKSYAPAYAAWESNRNPDTYSELLKALDPIIKSGQRAYAPASGPSLRSRAKQIAIRALDSYDPKKGPIKPHLMSHLQGLMRLSAVENSPIRIPERVALDRKRMDEVEVELEDQLGRMPSDDEIAEAMGVSRSRITNIRRAHKPLSEGRIMSSVSAEGEEGAGSPAVTIPGMDKSDDEWVELVYDSLGSVDQVILESVLGLHGRRAIPPQKIAAKLGITPGAVSQRMKRIQAILDKRNEYGLL